ncbi:MAG: EAL domain-containing protein [Gammaproteobacteria bacterium]|nr:EAL domain-containing protein [Gammaproteobacteria bacterium]
MPIFDGFQSLPKNLRNTFTKQPPIETALKSATTMAAHTASQPALTLERSAPLSSKENGRTNHKAPVSTFTINANGLITDFQGQVFASSGMTAEDFFATSVYDENSIFSGIKSHIKLALSGEHTSATIKYMNRTFSIWLSPIKEFEEIISASGTCIEVTSYMQTQSALNEIQQEYLLLAEYSSDLITKYKPDGYCMYISPSVANILGYEITEIVGTHVLHFFHPDDLKSKRRILGKLLDKTSTEAFCYRVRKKDGKYIWLETTSTVITHSKSGEIIEIIAVSKDITERKETEERLLYLANYDSLTGLPNRALFRDRLRRAVARAQRNNTQVGLFFIDLDRFKTINDSLGHHAGDQLLRGVSRRLKQFARKGDTIARLGGDEFTVILEGINDSEDAVIVAEKIIELMAPPFKLDGHEIVVSPSIGITIFPNDADDMRNLLKNADTAMYRAKEQGGNCFQFYTSDMNEKAYEYLVLETSLRHALEREEFKLYFQPQIDLHTHNIIGIEALLRWDNPERGLLKPDSFISFTEETGLIEPIGEWVLRKACEEAVQWQKMGLPAFRVAVNLSLRQFVASDFVSLVADVLRETGLQAKYLELEITESFLAQNVDQTAEILTDLHKLGVQLSIDDFGTGYSSLSYLKRFPLNTLKIDQSFVQDIMRDPDDATIAEAIIAMGRSLNLNVIAEGVESEEQVCFLRSHGCDWIQGHLVSEPLSAPKFLKWLKKNHSKQVTFEQEMLWPEIATR